MENSLKSKGANLHRLTANSLYRSHDMLSRLVNSTASTSAALDLQTQRKPSQVDGVSSRSDTSTASWQSIPLSPLALQTLNLQRRPVRLEYLLGNNGHNRPRRSRMVGQHVGSGATSVGSVSDDSTVVVTLSESEIQAAMVSVSEANSSSAFSGTITVSRRETFFRNFRSSNAG